ncbi:ParM/StbA family protein [Pseudoflavonifractor phocaeensis]|uniref:ParM/StbA family protein n=1 Tax=Pseudoflavonifractor phocaeensis TaxID=1870988 RepID=UPI00195B8E9A|nr:ParM/StbA family protein [Pseudoflavonifractor phocaeensis]MBM6721578.1 ParM/StbA family protein [Pseudoflavonifractor phocaeensis]
MLIGIDHGNKQIKTSHCSPFTSGVKESDVLPFGKDILKYDGKYYQLTDQRIPYHRDKTSDHRFFVLTLFAIAQELDIQNVDGRDTLRVQLAVGLPPAHYGAQHLEFSQYFLGRGVTNFTYQDKPYSILIDDVGCYPQSYAAAATIIRTLQDAPRALIVDIGGFTADYLQVKNGEGDLSICDSLENGVILLYNKTRSRVSAEQDVLLDEAEIDAILIDRSPGTPPSLGDLVRRQAKEFVDDLLSTLRERGLELRSGPVVFVGGGSILLRRQIEASGKVRAPVFVDDIRANARGYELLYRVCHSRR